MRLTAQDLAVRRSGRRIFSGLSFALGPGEALMVTGRNGAGKSTLLAVLAGRLKPEAGTVTASEVGEATLSECLHVVGHRDGLKSPLTAEENLAFARDLLGAPTASPRAALEELGLGHALRLPVAYLSAGQRRRVALARLLVCRRPLWLLDEPTAALDAASQEVLAGNDGARTGRRAASSSRRRTRPSASTTPGNCGSRRPAAPTQAAPAAAADEVWW